MIGPHARQISTLILGLLLALVLVGCAPGVPFVVPAVAPESPAASTVHIYHFSDYHSHALPAYAEGDPMRGGVARVVGLLAQARQQQENVLAFSGGDTMNLDNPIWSNEYTCTEWAWFNNIMDGMALGNHELDYGPETFQRCSYQITYPILSASLVYSDTAQPYLPEYTVYTLDGVKVGVFAVAGNDYPGIIQPEMMPAGTRWLSEEEELARVAAIVETLRTEEDVDVVVSIGH